jgi:hypothetical protein
MLDVMGKSHTTHGREEKFWKESLKEKNRNGYIIYRREDNIKRNLRDMGHGVA